MSFASHPVGRALPAHVEHVRTREEDIRIFLTEALSERSSGLLISDNGQMIPLSAGSPESVHHRIAFALERSGQQHDTMEQVCTTHALHFDGVRALNAAVGECHHHNHHWSLVLPQIPTTSDLAAISKLGIGSLFVSHFTQPTDQQTDFGSAGIDRAQYLEMMRLRQEGKMHVYWQDPLQQLRVFQRDIFVKMQSLDAHQKTNLRFLLMCSHRAGSQEGMAEHLTAFMEQLRDFGRQHGIQLGITHGGEDAGLMQTVREIACQTSGVLSYGISSVFRDARGLRPDFHSDGILIFTEDDLRVRQEELDYFAEMSAVLRGGVGSLDEIATRLLTQQVGHSVPSPMLADAPTWNALQTQLQYLVQPAHLAEHQKLSHPSLAQTLRPVSDMSQGVGAIADFIRDPEQWWTSHGFSDEIVSKGLRSLVARSKRRHRLIAPFLLSACAKRGIDATGIM